MAGDLRLCAFRSANTRKGPYNFLPKLVTTAFDQMLGGGNEPYDGARLSSIVLQSLRACDGILAANERSSQEYVVTYAPIYPHAQNLFSTHDQSMVSLSTPFVAGTIVDPAGDHYLDGAPQPADTPVKRLILEHQSVFSPDGPSGDDVAQGELGTCVLLSTLASIADHDPGQIRRMVRPSTDGSSFDVTFFRTATVQERPCRMPQRIVVEPRFPHLAHPDGTLTLVTARPGGDFLPVRGGQTPHDRRRQVLRGDGDTGDGGRLGSADGTGVRRLRGILRPGRDGLPLPG